MLNRFKNFLAETKGSKFATSMFTFLSTLSIDAFTKYVESVGKVKDFRSTNNEPVIQRCHFCLMSPRWLDHYFGKYDPEKPKERNLYFREEMCPGNCAPCWEEWPPRPWACVHKDRCGDLETVPVRYQYNETFFPETNFIIIFHICLIFYIRQKTIRVRKSTLKTTSVMKPFLKQEENYTCVCHI